MQFRDRAWLAGNIRRLRSHCNRPDQRSSACLRARSTKLSKAIACSSNETMTTGPKSYGICPWFPEHGVELIHPDDLALFGKFRPAGKVFRVSTQDDWLQLAYGDQAFRVRLQLIRWVPPTKFDIGDHVLALQHGDMAQAVVDGIEWHHKLKSAHVFFAVWRQARLSQIHGR